MRILVQKLTDNPILNILLPINAIFLLKAIINSSNQISKVFRPSSIYQGPIRNVSTDRAKQLDLLLGFIHISYINIAHDTRISYGFLIVIRVSISDGQKAVLKHQRRHDSFV